MRPQCREIMAIGNPLNRATERSSSPSTVPFLVLRVTAARVLRS